MIGMIIKEFGKSFSLIDSAREISNCLFKIKSDEIFDRPSLGNKEILANLLKEGRTKIIESELSKADKITLIELPDECLLRFFRDLYLSVLKLDGHLMHVR
ncbi:MAG: hypothetical protein Q8Q67_01005 [bacterium]|nr:hypothetical protein [bacterium]